MVRKTSFLAVCGLVIAGVAVAGVPSAINSSIGSGVLLTARTTAGAPSEGTPFVTKSITVRDGSNALVVGSNVVINFGTCHQNGIKLDNFPGSAAIGIVNCAQHAVYALTNGSGVATFKIVGGDQEGAGPYLSTSAPCATVVADGQLLGNLIVATLDMDNANGIIASDVAAWSSDRNVAIGTGVNRQRSDYDGNGVVNAADVSIWSAARNFAIANGSQSTAACAP
ncbi:MAG: hypothetical protein E6K78_09885 [Candidatus Eisenbacteria bacterium]|uniref:Dockerin domain-containing protein n=1 Tax=Eiseniibacteriota bacterium TaxID=2212470 RepID=A0A538TKC0_UNCEI|nr:MAG: hypothetical protein E6K78_09885 [Candidatus Eisenbacteria bacterium]